MSPAAILLPLFVQVALTFALLFWMGSSRVAAITRREVPLPKGSPRVHSWPGRVQQVSDCFHNQLELPIFLYLAIVVALVAGKADWWLVGLAWVFVATRLVHAYIHTGSNRPVVRFRWFGAGALALGAMWVLLAVRVLAGL